MALIKVNDRERTVTAAPETKALRCGACFNGMIVKAMATPPSR